MDGTEVEVAIVRTFFKTGCMYVRWRESNQDTVMCKQEMRQPRHLVRNHPPSIDYLDVGCPSVRCEAP